MDNHEHQLVSDRRGWPIARLLEFVSTLGYEINNQGLGPAQWRAIRYFADANRTACTVLAFSRQAGISKGSASKTVALLVEKGLLRRSDNHDDRRSHFLELTSAGDAILSHDPLIPLAEAVDSLDNETREAVVRALEILARDLWQEVRTAS